MRTKPQIEKPSPVPLYDVPLTRRKALAKRTWKALGQSPEGKKEQLRVISELVETRTEELLRAYKGVKSVSWGYKRKAAKCRKGLCVKFRVRKKRSTISEEKRLPLDVLAYATVDNSRQLVVIPTDVEETRLDHRIKPQNVRRIAISAGNELEYGTITCGVKVRGPQGYLEGHYAVSCRHVLHMTRAFHPRRMTGGDVSQADAVTPIASITRIRGALSHQALRSHDVALARITDLPRFRELLASPRPQRWIQDDTYLGDSVYIWRPEINRPQRLRIVEAHLNSSFSIQYDTSTGPITVFHRRLFECQGDTRPGDSGSPVTTDPEGTRLAGIHIAGDGTEKAPGSRAFFIPAYELMNASRLDGFNHNHRFILNP